MMAFAEVNLRRNKRRMKHKGHPRKTELPPNNKFPPPKGQKQIDKIIKPTQNWDEDNACST